MKTQNKAGEEVNKGFEDLKAWQLARQLMIGCHKLAQRLPAIERNDLIPQIRRSSKSVMANIAEGRIATSITAAVSSTVSIA